MLSAVTVSLVPEARGGPFVFWDDVAKACQSAKRLGFDAIELFAPSPNAIPVQALSTLLAKHSLRLAAVGTGAGMVKHKLSLSDPDSTRRREAIQFARSMIEYGSELQAPAIIGSMQGRWVLPQTREQALEALRSSIQELADFAQSRSVPLIFEPVNRYETNLITSVTVGCEFLNSLKSKNVKLLADLFHLNIEEPDIAEALRQAGNAIGHVHFADSNRFAAGFGHTDFVPIIAALHEIGYEGYLSAEVLSLPDAEAAAAMTIKTYRQLMGSDYDEDS
jgi:sugar phosphate isomerase/epimerase